MTNLQKAFKIGNGNSSASNSTVSESIADTSTTQESVDDCISEADHSNSERSENVDNMNKSGNRDE